MARTKKNIKTITGRKSSNRVKGQQTNHSKKTAKVKAKYFRKEAKSRVEDSYRTILTSLTEKACGGSLQHTKMLFDLGGVKEELEEAAKERKLGPSLGRLLLKEAANFRRKKEAEKARKQGVNSH
jgi:hypothetical protein